MADTPPSKPKKPGNVIFGICAAIAASVALVSLVNNTDESDPVSVVCSGAFTLIVPPRQFANEELENKWRHGLEEFNATIGNIKATEVAAVYTTFGEEEEAGLALQITLPSCRWHWDWNKYLFVKWQGTNGKWYESKDARGDLKSLARDGLWGIFKEMELDETEIDRNVILRVDNLYTRYPLEITFFLSPLELE